MAVITVSVGDALVLVDEHLWESPRTILVSKGTHEVTLRPCDARWHVARTSKPYVVSMTSMSAGHTLVYLHRAITQAAPRTIVDHINANCLDNRLGNLRVTDHFGNAHNKRASRNSTSRFVGVNRHRKKWQAFARVGNRRIHLGTFMNEEDAAIARDTWVKTNRPEFGYLNFPEVHPASN